MTDGSAHARYVGRNVCRALTGAALPKAADAAAEG